MDQLIQYALIIILMVTLSACDNRKCLKSHQEMMLLMQPIYIGNNMSLIPTWWPVDVCDEYEPKLEESI